MTMKEVFRSEEGVVYWHGNTSSFAFENLEYGKNYGSTCQFGFTPRKDLSEIEASAIPANNFEAGWFSFTALPGCCGVVVSHDTKRIGLFQDWNKKLSDDFRAIKEKFAKKLGYSMIIATTDMANIPAVGNMIKSGYTMNKPFTNKRTGNLLSVGVKAL